MRPLWSSHRLTIHDKTNVSRIFLKYERMLSFGQVCLTLWTLESCHRHTDNNSVEHIRTVQVFMSVAEWENAAHVASVTRAEFSQKYIAIVCLHSVSSFTSFCIHIYILSSSKKASDQIFAHIITVWLLQKWEVSDLGFNSTGSSPTRTLQCSRGLVIIQYVFRSTK